MSHMIEEYKSQKITWGSGNLHTKPCKGDVNHSDVEHGTISSFNELPVCEIQISMRESTPTY
jgi:hypothetical protein